MHREKLQLVLKEPVVLVYLGVVEGDKVKKGQIIARLDDRDIVAQLDEAKSSLQLYKAQMNRS
ncbi:MAG: biotin/lipoyl-binding protein [Ignavibacteriales bacterium]|nr:biotin/lipoyl-binding protein [Ignavibacteriales bacterium]